MKTYWQKIKGIVGPATIKKFDEIGQKKTREAFENFIIAHSTAKSKLLDAGCNTGVEAHRLLRLGYKGKYLGVDSNGKAINLARNNLKMFDNASFEIQNLEKLPFKTKEFGIVLLKDVIEHHKHYSNILTELTRITKSYLILSMFIKPSLFFPDKIKLHPDGYYLNRYNRKALFDFITSCGFNQPEVIYKDFQDEVFVFKRI